MSDILKEEIKFVKYRDEDIKSIIFRGNVIWSLTHEEDKPYESDPYVDYSREPFTIVPLEDGIVRFYGEPYQSGTLYHSANKTSWTAHTVTKDVINTISLTGKKNTPIYIKCSGRFNYFTADVKTKKYLSVWSDVPYIVSGNLKTYIGGEATPWGSNNAYDSFVNLFSGRFIGTSEQRLVDARYLYIPKLYATGSTNAYSLGQMFQNNSNLKNAPLRLTKNGYEACAYNSLFNGCTGLVDLHECVLCQDGGGAGNYEWDSMCQNCTNLEYGPKIMATGGYSSTGNTNIFKGCPKLKWIFDMHTSIPAAVSSSYHDSTMPSTGIFVKNYNASWTTAGVIPSGWTTIYYNITTKKYYLSNKTTECTWDGKTTIPTVSYDWIFLDGSQYIKTSTYVSNTSIVEVDLDLNFPASSEYWVVGSRKNTTEQQFCIVVESNKTIRFDFGNKSSIFSVDVSAYEGQRVTLKLDGKNRKGYLNNNLICDLSSASSSTWSSSYLLYIGALNNANTPLSDRRAQTKIYSVRISNGSTSTEYKPVKRNEIPGLSYGSTFWPFFDGYEPIMGNNNG